MDNETFEEIYAKLAKEEAASIEKLQIEHAKYKKALEDIIQVPPIIGGSNMMFDLAFQALKEEK